MGLAVPLRAVLVLLAAALTAGAWAAPLSGAVTLGSALETEPTGLATCETAEFPRGCLGVNDVLPGRQVTAPMSGVIVRWRVRLGTNTDAQAIASAWSGA